MTNQTWLARVDQKTPNGYECDKEPGYYEEKDGWKVVTALSKIQVKMKKQGTLQNTAHICTRAACTRSRCRSGH